MSQNRKDSVTRTTNFVDSAATPYPHLSHGDRHNNREIGLLCFAGEAVSTQRPKAARKVEQTARMAGQVPAPDSAPGVDHYAKSGAWDHGRQKPVLYVEFRYSSALSQKKNRGFESYLASCGQVRFELCKKKGYWACKAFAGEAFIASGAGAQPHLAFRACAERPWYADSRAMRKRALIDVFWGVHCNLHPMPFQPPAKRPVVETIPAVPPWGFEGLRGLWLPVQDRPVYQAKPQVGLGHALKPLPEGMSQEDSVKAFQRAESEKAEARQRQMDKELAERIEARRVELGVE